ncbi:phosphatidylglycerophosphatase A [Xenophilus sp. Marseille-Q4582]|uniref:phosphatidylglycerophosphatase A family protein n=1 Tax=Xenophilus sp. Marseille-Q4582 TaxID=2866600 RepID=UPI001CE47803|nr:phosphatidylglycerophosphatase A [Xenophilus sp. Marseille-Q4582]
MTTDAASPSPAPRRPSARFLLSHPAHFIALGAGTGLSPVAPGTAGTLWAWVAFLVMQQWLSPAALGGLILAGLPVGWWACSVTARHMNVADPGAIVWDEIIAFWLVLWLLMPAGPFMQATAFLLFRFFDAAKPGPVGWADQRFKPLPGQPRWWRAGWGILFDDLVAAFCTLLAIALFMRMG